MTLHRLLTILVVLLAMTRSVPSDEPKDPPKAARLVRYSGQVQGVGFRATTVDIARNHPVTGWVKNLDDGRVQLEVEGAPAEVTAYLAALEERMHGHIRKTERSEHARTPQFSGFSIQ